MCLTNIQETEYRRRDQSRMAYKVTWIGKGFSAIYGEYTGPFSPEPIVRGEWRLADDAIDHVRTNEREWEEDEDLVVMKSNPSSGLRSSYNSKSGPCYHVFWSQKNAAKYIVDFLDTFDHIDKRMCTYLRIEAVQVSGEIKTGQLDQYVPGAGLTAATATRIKFEDNA
jgi:hypothetical protein